MDEFAFLKQSCILGNAIITIKNIKTNEIFSLPIETVKKEIKDYSNFKIKTKNGFKSFYSINERNINSYYNLKFRNIKDNKIFELNLTGSHLIDVNNNWRKVAYIKTGTKILDNILISKQRIRKIVKVYDILDINEEHSFLTSYDINLHNCEAEFLQSVFPVVSSSKTSKIIIVSTPNGMGNEFYRTWNRAQLKLNNEDDKSLRWQTVKVDWWEVPGRDEKWKKQQLETFNGSEEKFLQEYGNCLCHSTILNIFDKEKNKVEEYSIGELYFSLLKQNNKNVENYLIETPNGFVNFNGVVKNNKECIKLIFENTTSIECSIDHPFVIDNKIIRANELNIGDYLNSKNGNIIIVNIINIGMKTCFDLINVGDDHIFYANNIITHNSFLGSAETLIRANVIKKIKDHFIENSIEPHQIQLHKDYSKTMVNIYEPPQKGHAYIIGADPALGAESDYHAMIVYDITNTYQIKQVVGFYENDIPPKMFAYMLAKTAMLYNNAYVAIENNGCSEVVLDALWRDFDYDNIINDGGNPKTNIGIHSTPERKTQACLTFKIFVEDELRNIQLNDGRLISELEKFERKSRTGKLPVYCAADGHDDYMMAAIWGLYCIQMDIIENYYDVKKAVVNKLGEQIPLYILPYKSDMDVKTDYLNNIDEKFKSFINEYEMKLDKINNDDNGKLMDEFIKNNALSEAKSYTQEDDEIPERKTDSDRFQFTFGIN